MILNQGCVVAATVFPKFLKFCSPPHDLAFVLNRLIRELLLVIL